MHRSSSIKLAGIIGNLHWVNALEIRPKSILGDFSISVTEVDCSVCPKTAQVTDTNGLSGLDLQIW